MNHRELASVGAVAVIVWLGGACGDGVFDSSQVDTATENVANFLEEECGIEDASPIDSARPYRKASAIFGSWNCS